jgi:hypothetical protein
VNARKKEKVTEPEYYPAPTSVNSTQSHGSRNDAPTRVTNRDIAEIVRKGEGNQSPIPSAVNQEGGISARERVIKARTAGPIL